MNFLQGNNIFTNIFRRNVLRRAFHFVAAVVFLAFVFVPWLRCFSLSPCSHDMPYTVTMAQLTLSAAFAACTILFGKLFCSYLCPLGFLSELLFRLRRQLEIKAVVVRNGSFADKLLRSVKYLMLFAIQFLFYIIVFAEEEWPLGSGITAGIVVLAASLLLCTIVIDMFWCRYVCPLAALSNILRFTLLFVIIVLLYGLLEATDSNISPVWFLAAAVVAGYIQEIVLVNSRYNAAFLYIYKDDRLCRTCGGCSVKCPQNIDLQSVTNVITNVDCTLCGECIAECDKKVLRLTNSKRGRYLPPLLIILLLLAALYAGKKIKPATLDVRRPLYEQLQEREPAQEQFIELSDF